MGEYGWACNSRPKVWPAVAADQPNCPKLNSEAVNDAGPRRRLVDVAHEGVADSELRGPPVLRSGEDVLSQLKGLGWNDGKNVLGNWNGCVEGGGVEARGWIERNGAAMDRQLAFHVLACLCACVCLSS